MIFEQYVDSSRYSLISGVYFYIDLNFNFIWQPYLTFLRSNLRQLHHPRALQRPCPPARPGSQARRGSRRSPHTRTLLRSPPPLRLRESPLPRQGLIHSLPEHGYNFTYS